MKVLFKLLWILLIAGILEACNASGRLEYALECAATNKGELEKVLEHYKDEPEKYKAACFLIENMPYHYALEGEELDSLKTVLASADAYGVMLKDTAVPDWDYYTPSGLQRKPDVLNIRAEFLINNIDLAFDGWKKRPWNASLSFADFCEWLLPYRIGNETPDNWRQIYHDRYSFLLDEVYTGIDVVEAISVVWEYLQKEDPYRFTWVFNYPHLGGEYLLHNRIGKCQDACDFMIYVMRAIGVPVAYDFYTFNAETRKGHVWNVVRDVTGVCLPFTFPSRKPERGSFYIDSRRPSVVYRRCFGRQWDMDGDFMIYVMRAIGVPVAYDFYTFNAETRKGHVWNVVRDVTGVCLPFTFPSRKPERGSFYIDSRRPSVVYRRCFGRQWDMDGDFMRNRSVPAAFKDVFARKVSDNYFDSNLELPVEGMDGNYVYVGLFSAYGWRGIDFTKVESGKALFRNLASRQVYILLAFANGQYRPIGNPFYFDGKDIHPYVADTSKCYSAELYRKYPLSERIRNYMGGIKDGHFEAACDKDFKNAELLCTVKDTPGINYNHVILEKPVRGRYARFCSSAEGYAEVAEMHFYKGEEEIVPIDSWGDAPATANTFAYQVYDNEPLSYFISSKPGASVTVDFGKVVTIDNFMYMPRNDDNFVRIGDYYELFYWGEGCWNSLGKKMAEKPFLPYDGIPSGALLYLHDSTRGEEELIFHMEDGKQVFVSDCKD